MTKVGVKGLSELRSDSVIKFTKKKGTIL